MNIQQRTQYLFNPVAKTCFLLIFSLLLLSKNISSTLDMRLDRSLLLDGHAVASLQLAVNAAFCKKMSYVINAVGHSDYVTLFSKISHNSQKPIISVILNNYDSEDVAHYCAKVTSPFVNNENTLSWLMQSLFFVYPKLSLHQLHIIFFVLQCLMVSFFFFFLAQLRINSIYILGLMLTAISSLVVAMSDHIISLYPFLLPSVLFMMAGLGFILRYELYKTFWFGTVCLNILIGCYAFFLSNLRTTYHIAAFLMVMLYLAMLIISIINTRSRFYYVKVFLHPMIILVTFLCCWLLILKPAITENVSNLHYHVIAHPLVLSLALPANQFAEQQGIQWNDAVGVVLAQRIDPKTQYIGPGYEKALFSYYKFLWKNYPKNMLQIYYEKLKLTGTQMVMNTHLFTNDVFNPSSKVSALIMFPLSFFTGFYTLLLQLLLLMFFIKKADRFRLDERFLVMALVMLGVALYFESAIIMPFYVPTYHAYLIFWFAVMNFIMWDAMLRCFFRVFEWAKFKSKAYLLSLRSTGESCQ